MEQEYQYNSSFSSTEAKRYGLSLDLYRSIVGFNGSPHADRRSVQSFLVSYLMPPHNNPFKAMDRQVRFRPEIRRELSLKENQINKLIVDLINEKDSRKPALSDSP